MTIDTKSRHRTKAGGNVFADLGFPPDEAKRLLDETDAQIDEAVRLKRQLMDEIASWMKDTNLTQAGAAIRPQRRTRSGLSSDGGRYRTGA